MGFDGSSTLQAPPNIADEFQTGWYVLPGHAFGRGTRMQLFRQERKLSAPRECLPWSASKALPIGQYRNLARWHQRVLHHRHRDEWHFVTFFRSGFAYQISLNGGRTITTEAQKSVLLGLVDQLQPA